MFGAVEIFFVGLLFYACQLETLILLPLLLYSRLLLRRGGIVFVVLVEIVTTSKGRKEILLYSKLAVEYYLVNYKHWGRMLKNNNFLWKIHHKLFDGLFSYGWINFYCYFFYIDTEKMIILLTSIPSSAEAVLVLHSIGIHFVFFSFLYLVFMLGLALVPDRVRRNFLPRAFYPVSRCRNEIMGKFFAEFIWKAKSKNTFFRTLCRLYRIGLKNIRVLNKM